MQTVAIIDYGSGNLRSAARAMAAAAADAGLDRRVAVTDRPEVVARADRVVLPGVGAFADCRAGLLALDGMVEAMGEAVRQRGRPFLGICVGMQLLATRGTEHGETPGLGWLAGTAGHLDPAHPEAAPGAAAMAGGTGCNGLKIPHMGWNRLRLEAPAHPLLDGIGDGDYTYFVHSYVLDPDDPADRLASAEYGRPFAAVVGHSTVVGTQFHPEKSQRVGLRLIANFLAWMP